MLHSFFLFKGSDGADIVTSGKYWLHQNKKIMEMIAPFSLTWTGNKYAEWLEVCLTQAFSVRSLQILRRSMFLNYGIVFILYVTELLSGLLVRIHINIQNHPSVLI